MMPAGWTAVAALTYLAAASLWDVRTGRIPNALTAAALLLALLDAAALGGLPRLGSALLGAALGLGLLAFPFARGWVGAGDAKFLAATGAWVGPHLLLVGFIIGTVLGGMVAAVFWARGRKLLPYAVPLALGNALALALAGEGWRLLL